MILPSGSLGTDAFKVAVSLFSDEISMIAETQIVMNNLTHPR